LLQDLWEIGASPEIVIKLLKESEVVKTDSKILDLGCGKGAVLIKLVKEFGCQGHGIDALPEFIEEARQYAQKNKVEKNCIFEIGDIRRVVDQLKEYDGLILGSIGPVFGNIKTTLIMAKKCIKDDGFILLDDGYLSNESELNNPIYLNEAETLKQIDEAKMKIVNQQEISPEFIKKSNKMIYNHIHKRSQELMKKYPKDQSLFEGYLKSQEEENDLLENHITCVTWLLNKKN
jgi:cyclopropane fatty-acyl-phospholipid synthase-like methyltransferase